MHHRLVVFARSCAAGKEAGNLHPNIALSAGSFLPNSPDPKQDKTWAKIVNCSRVFLDAYKNWGSMNQVNMKVMKKKLAAGQVRRNVIGPKDAKTAEDLLKKKKEAVVVFKNSMTVGASVSYLKLPRPSAQEVAAQELGAVRRAGSAAAATAGSSSARPAAASSSSAASVPVAEVAATPCKVRPATPAAAPAVQPKARPTSGTAGPAFRTQPAATVILHVYSLGMESLLEGSKQI